MSGRLPKGGAVNAEGKARHATGSKRSRTGMTLNAIILIRWVIIAGWTTADSGDAAAAACKSHSASQEHHGRAKSAALAQRSGLSQWDSCAHSDRGAARAGRRAAGLEVGAGHHQVNGRMLALLRRLSLSGCDRPPTEPPPATRR
jgi:hypothetical protein